MTQEKLVELQATIAEMKDKYKSNIDTAAARHLKDTRGREWDDIFNAFVAGANRVGGLRLENQRVEGSWVPVLDNVFVANGPMPE